MRSTTLARAHQVVLGLAMATTFMAAVRSFEHLDDGLEIRLVSGHTDRCSLTLREGRDSLDVRTRGKVELADLFGGEGPTHPVRPSRGGRFRVEEETAGISRRLEITAGPDGEPVYRYHLDGRESPFDAPTRAWLEDVVLTCYRVAGVDAENRATRLYEAGGADAVLDEIAHLDGDEAASRYLLVLLEAGADSSLSDGDLESLLGRVNRSVDSDYWQRRLLVSVPPQRLASAAVAHTFFRAARELDSDTELRTVLEHAAEAPLEPGGWSAFFLAAGSIDSDHQLQRLMETYASQSPSPLPEEVDRVLASIDSDTALAKALGALLSRPGLTVSETDRLLSIAASGLDSDHTASMLLVDWARETRDPQGAMPRGALRLLRSIDADSAQADAANALISRAGRDELAHLLQALTIRSGDVLTNVLIRAAASHASAGGQDADVESILDDALRSIPSESHRHEVRRAWGLSIDPGSTEAARVH